MTNKEEPTYESDPLGGGVFVEGFDLPPPERPELSPDQWDKEIDECAGGNLGVSWNTLPSGEPGVCQPNLFVDVRSASDIHHMFGITLQHLRVCRYTKVVIFHVGGSIGYLQWMQALIPQLPKMRDISSQNTTFVTRVSYSWTPRPTQNPIMWRGAIINLNMAFPAGRDQDASTKLQSQPHLNMRAMLKHRVWLLEELGLLCEDFNYINYHNKQPTIPTKGSDISFGTRKTDQIQDWKSRIYLDDSARDYPLGFHLQRTPYLNAPNVNCGADSWIASNRNGFLIDPYRWLDTNNLINRRP